MEESNAVNSKFNSTLSKLMMQKRVQQLVKFIAVLFCCVCTPLLFWFLVHIFLEREYSFGFDVLLLFVAAITLLGNFFVTIGLPINICIAIPFRCLQSHPCNFYNRDTLENSVAAGRAVWKRPCSTVGFCI